MKRLLLTSALVLSACGTPKTLEPPVGMVGDAVSTYVMMTNHGFYEANPIMAKCGSPAGVAFCSIIGKLGVEWFYVQSGGDLKDIRHTLNVAGTAVTVWNFTQSAGAALIAGALWDVMTSGGPR